jgi:Ca2+-dependent lipid-binding protein
MSRRLLTVTIISGKNLVSAEKKGTSSPFCVVTLQDIAGRAIKNENGTTPHKSKTLEPRWDARLNFGNLLTFFFTVCGI